MKRLFLIAILILLTGCATIPRPAPDLCKDMQAVMQYVTVENGAPRFTDEFIATQKTNFEKAMNYSYSYLGNISTTYEAGCSLLTTNECWNFKPNSDIDCRQVQNRYICTEQTSMYTPNGKIGYSSPYLIYDKMTGVLVVESSGNELTYVGTLCPEYGSL